MCVYVHVCVFEQESQSFTDRVYWVYVCVCLYLCVHEEEKWRFSLEYSAEQVVHVLYSVCVSISTQTHTRSYVACVSL